MLWERLAGDVSQPNIDQLLVLFLIQERSAPPALNLHHLQFCFASWLGGIALACGLFLGELLSRHLPGREDQQRRVAPAGPGLVRVQLGPKSTSVITVQS